MTDTVQRRILVIDDEQHLRTVVKACLETLGGWIVLTAESGQEGLLKAEAEQPDAILLDVMMPDMNGLTLLQMLKDHPTTQTIPVILLTAKVQASDHHRYAQLNVVGVIDKPFAPLRLSQQVADALGWN
jgi:CheY-like chemotaxis protein